MTELLLFYLIIVVLGSVILKNIWLKSNRYHTEVAENYWYQEYLDYKDNNWFEELHFCRIMTPILEKLFLANEKLK